MTLKIIYHTKTPSKLCNRSKLPLCTDTHSREKLAYQNKEMCISFLLGQVESSTNNIKPIDT